jgi:hypothetical protein
MVRRPFAYVVSHMCFAATMVIAAGATAVVLAQTPPADEHHRMAPNAAAGKMMTGQKEMMAKMAASEKKLTELLAKMNAAQGDEKVAAIAALVNELASQRIQMQQMMSMQTGMMAHMSAMHGTGGMMNKKAPEPAPQAGEPPDASHREHHPEQ